MPVVKRKLKSGWRYAYDKTVKGTRLWTPYIFLREADAEAAEYRDVAVFMETGRLPATLSGPISGETVRELYKRWVQWLKDHRSQRHARDMAGLMARALEQGQEWAEIPAAALTVDDIETWGSRWASDLLERDKGRGEVNKWLRYSQTAYNAPWGRRRAEREYTYNPFQFVDRFQVERAAKYVPTAAEVHRLRMAADGEYRLYLEILTETGARPSEGLNLAWADVHAGALAVILYTAKTGTGDTLPRRVPISQNLAARFRAWRKEQAAGLELARWVFQQEESAAPRWYSWARKRQHYAAKAAGVGVWTVGCLRHYHAVTYYQETRDIIAVQRRLGHTSSKTTEHYLQSLMVG